MSNALTIGQLQSLGFEVYWKKRKGEQVFDSCCLDHKQCSYDEQKLLGTFYSPPTILQIVNQVAENAKNKEYWRIKEAITAKLLDTVDI